MGTPRHDTAKRGAEKRIVDAIASAGQNGLSSMQLAAATGMRVTSVRWWLQRLMAAGQVEALAERRDVGGTRPQKVYRMARAQRGGMHALPARVRMADRVVTPSDRVAVVMEIEGRTAELEYVDGDARGPATAMVLQLDVSLLAPWPKGAERPRPVRLGTLTPERRGAASSPGAR